MKTKTKILPRKRASDPRSANQIASDRDYAKRFPLKAAEDKALTKRLAAHSRRAKRVRAGATAAPNVSELRRREAAAAKAFADETDVTARLKLELRAAMKRNDEIGAELARCRSLLARIAPGTLPCLTVYDLRHADRQHDLEGTCRVRISYDNGARIDDVVRVVVAQDIDGHRVVYLHPRPTQKDAGERSQ